MESMNRFKTLSFFLLFSITHSVFAAEGAWSAYVPGSYGDFKVAQITNAGLYLRNDFIFYDGDIQKAVLQGKLNNDLELDAFINMFNMQYYSEYMILGAHFGVGFKVPYYSADFNARVAFDGNNFVPVQEDKSGFGDIMLKPVMLNWQLPYYWHLTLYQGVSVPTGGYSINRNFNIGRNYWAFDTNAAVTWANPDYAIEISAIMGYLRNLKNSETEYLSGGEFHLDYNIAYYITEKVAIGLTGMYYDQVNGDERNGALLGKSEASSIGLGPSMLLTFDIEPFVPVNLIFKLIYETDTENRFKGKYWTIGVSTQFV